MSQELRFLSLRLKIGLDIASGLQWLASHGIVHRDLKLPNCMTFFEAKFCSLKREAF
jgi:serine/threonine protein kinase